MESVLPARLSELLDAITDREVALRVERVLKAAAHASEQLGHLNLVKLEPAGPEDEGPDLALWEKMAPAVRDTVVAVNQILTAVRAEYPEGGTAASEFASNSDDRVDAEAGQVFRAVARRLGSGVNEVGGMMRRPELMGSRWKLLGELQRLRGEFRALLGDAVWLTAAAIAGVRREDVVPGQLQEVARAVLFRRTAADVRRNLGQKLSRPEPVAKLARLIDQDLEIFFSLPAWRHVPAAAKQQVLTLRAGLLGLDSVEAMKGRVEGVSALLERLAAEHTSGILLAHDREAVAEAERKLEQAQLHLKLATGGVGAALSRAVGACEELYGRNAELDDFLRGLRNQSFSELTLGQLSDAIGRLRSNLRG